MYARREQGKVVHKMYWLWSLRVGEEAEGDDQEGKLAPNGTASAVLAFSIGREGVADTHRQGNVVAHAFHHRPKTILGAESELPLKAERQAEKIDLRDVIATALRVQRVEPLEKTVTRGVLLKELQLERIVQPLRPTGPVRVVDDLVGERRERVLDVEHVLLSQSGFTTVLHHRVEQSENTTLQDVRRRQVRGVAEL